ncbi:MAG: response regulator [Bacteroidales bacterium]|nr:response regulator [Bacteroidales bacterium]
MGRIIIVDDASFMIGSLKYMVENAGHEVVGTAKEGGEALNLYKKLKPDLVTLDILMKGKDGISTLKAIMKLDPGAKVIMVSALGLDDTKKEASELGASGYIVKPFKQKQIIDEIQRVLGKDE